jgi:hypothetical protein
MRFNFPRYTTTAIGFAVMAFHMAMEQAADSSVTKGVFMRNKECLTLVLFLMEFPVMDIFAAYITF